VSARNPATGASPAGSLLRQGFWRAVLDLTGGITVSGTPPRGPAVLAANHSSHADTAALLAAVPWRSKPVFVAAADYWFTRPIRRLLVTTLAAAVPVHRNVEGSYAALRAASSEVLSRGGIVIVYPEGTRTKTGQVGRFHPGAVRLADDLDVPLIPAAVLGTRDVLPKNGRFRPSPVEVRFGEPFDSEGLAADPETAGIASARLRDRVTGLLSSGRTADPTSPLWDRTVRHVDGPAGLVGAFVWGTAEATSWPVIAEMYLALFAATRPRRILPCAAALAAGSVTGVVLNAALTRRGVHLPAPLTTQRMRLAAADHLGAGAWGIRHQPWGGIPVKVYAGQAGRLGTPLDELVVATTVVRSARILSVGLGATALASPFPATVRKRYGTYLVGAAALWALGERGTLRRWS